ncbi:MAG: hypothetical protein QS748_01965 [Candidatus Endonucleobacter bathymodioli]|uniref:Uncharacterized protein n=1 Tax=Candidatus Endonucleibacter bathymodioli TaxID=539814 RepID=A0AA90NWD0_9GAMM|nr:hypothetical protein [Candidatus Endonucleobacter bathymodioli]
MGYDGIADNLVVSSRDEGSGFYPVSKGSRWKAKGSWRKGFRLLA